MSTLTFQLSRSFLNLLLGDNQLAFKDVRPTQNLGLMNKTKLKLISNRRQRIKKQSSLSRMSKWEPRKSSVYEERRMVRGCGLCPWAMVVIGRHHNIDRAHTPRPDGFFVLWIYCSPKSMMQLFTTFGSWWFFFWWAPIDLPPCFFFFSC